MTPDEAFACTMAWLQPVEGEREADAHDPGGATRWGISLRFALTVGDSDQDGRPDLDVDGDGDVDAADIRALPWNRAVETYRRHFWRQMYCHLMPPRLGAAVLDCGINMGRGPAVTLLQRSVGAEPDGRVGPQTLGAVARARPDVALAAYHDARLVRYFTLADFPRYGKGWVRRVLALHHFCLTMLQDGAA